MKPLVFTRKQLRIKQEDLRGYDIPYDGVLYFLDKKRPSGHG